jgi:hypothetical protein
MPSRQIRHCGVLRTPFTRIQTIDTLAKRWKTTLSGTARLAEYAVGHVTRLLGDKMVVDNRHSVRERTGAPARVPTVGTRKQRREDFEILRRLRHLNAQMSGRLPSHSVERGGRKPGRKLPNGSLLHLALNKPTFSSPGLDRSDTTQESTFDSMIFAAPPRNRLGFVSKSQQKRELRPPGYPVPMHE